MSNKTPESKLVTYSTAKTPEFNGVYACRVDDEMIPGFLKDVFLMWFDGRWSYLGSDQRYRSEVKGWVGPLQRKL